MKRLLLMFFLQSLLSYTAFAHKQLTIALQFNPSDFWLNESRTNIMTDVHTFTYLSDTLKPAIPYISIQVLIPDSLEYSGFTHTNTKVFFSDNVILAPNPIEKPTDNSNSSHASIANYEDLQFPEENIIYTGKNCYGNYNVLNFLVAPWIYSANKKTLDILTSVDLTIDLHADRNYKSIENATHLFFHI